MSSDEEPEKKSLKDKIKDAFASGHAGVSENALFKPDELDIYINKLTRESYIFHGKEIDYDAIDYLEYDPDSYTVDVVKKDGTRQNLGVKIQWLVRPVFSRSQEVNIVQTKNRKSVKGTVVKLVHKDKK